MKRFYLILLVILSTQMLKAQEIGAAEVFYQQLNAKKFLVTANVYRSCNSLSLTSLDGFVIADTFKIPMNFKRVSISKINDTCGNPCNIQNSFSNPGYEKHIFTDTVDFSNGPYDSISNAGLCKVKFAIHQQLRSSWITTLNVGIGMFYIDAEVNLCYGFTNIHSPEFNVDPKFFAPCNFPMNYTPGPIDTFDRDSLSYSMETPMSDVNKPLTYKGSFSLTFPVTPYCPPNPGVVNCRALPNAKPSRGFYWDSELCEIVYTPVNCTEINVLKFKITKWRADNNGVMREVGYVCREMMTQIKNMPGNTPSYTTGLNKYNACENVKLCFNLNYKDDAFLPFQTVPDTIKLDWNQAIQGGEFKITNPTDREKTAQFCWTNKTSQKAGSYLFAAIVSDKQCNLNMSSYSYMITKYDSGKFNASHVVDTCGFVKYNVASAITGKAAVGNVFVMDASNKVVFNSTRMKDSFQLNKDGKYTIRYTVSNNSSLACPSIKVDTFEVKGSFAKILDFSVIDTAVCFTYPVSLAFNPSKINGLVNWSWWVNDTLRNSSDSAFSAEVDKYSFVVKLKATNNRGCKSESMKRYNAYYNTQVLFQKYEHYICNDDSFSITADTNLLKGPLKSQWQYASVDTLVNGVKYTFKPDVPTVINVVIKDANHCLVSDMLLVEPIKSPAIGLSTQSKVCADSNIVIASVISNSNGIKKTEWRINGKDTVTPVLLKLGGNFNAPTTITMKLTASYDCQSFDTLRIVPLVNPDFTLSKSDTICAGESIDINATVASGVSKLNNTWLENDQIQTDNDLIYNFKGKTDAWIKLRLNNDGTCFTEDSVFVKVNPLPVFEIESDTVFNRYNRIVMNTSKAFVSYKWSNGSNIRSNDFWAYDLGAPGKYNIRCEVTDINGCSASDTITIHTDGFTNINDPYLTNVQIYPNPADSRVEITTTLEGDLKLYNAEGKLLLKQNVPAGKSELDCSQLSTGVYTIEINGTVHKLVVRH
ncbi:MAG TPA: T9SS type A sorting domain-containing protein [Bacteroidia bacterium]